ncbi:cryptochrome/photolyase family protein [Streptomyces sp. NPDC056486]|uniref:cryptochrome/photolyase family protein n=1 Tax=Streptomyces sp. NPDC056486 TaxID=3345835 RepID=UPI0036AE0309
MTVSIVLFTSDLRLHDNPVLRAALRDAERIVPLFVYDDGVRATGFDVPNRRAFLADCLEDLDSGLRGRGGRLVVRSGDVVDEVCRVVKETGAAGVHVAGGVSRYATRREERLRAALEDADCRLVVHDAVVTAVAPGELLPAGKDHYAVFTPYHRRWTAAGVRDVVAPPRKVRVADVASESVLPRAEITGVSQGLDAGGESAGRRRLRAWLSGGIAEYEDGQDDVAGDATSRLSPHLHFGTLSATEVIHGASREGSSGAQAFIRQLAWRDFHHQVLAARPDAAAQNYRTRGDRWRTNKKEIAAWVDGRTGYPFVDAAMRQLSHEGWMHNRARLVVASFLTKTLYVDWRVGAQHFLSLLVDGDVANNQMNWQWAAGTGTDTRPNRVLNPVIQGKRFDPRGSYVRRWLPELADVPDRYIHEPWKLTGQDRADADIDYPDPIVDLAEGRARFEQARDA